MVPNQIKYLAIVLLIGISAFSGFYIKNMQDDNEKLRIEQKEMLTRLNNAEVNINRLDSILVRREEVNSNIRNKVADVTIRVKQEAMNDPPTRDFLTTVLPNGLRRAVLETRPTSPSDPNTNSTNSSGRSIQDVRGVGIRSNNNR